MKLTLRHCDWMDDWFVIERAEHDGREWLEKTGPNSFSHRCSSRFSDADVEGTANEMRAIALAIKERRDCSFKRCAVRFGGDIVLFSSPRNSQTPGVASIEEADALADEIPGVIESARVEETK